MAGSFDSGMSGGCQWSPFNIDFDEYEELVLELVSLNNNLVTDEMLDGRNYQEWFLQALEKHYPDQVRAILLIQSYNNSTMA
ncbi:MAG: hypothetical protein HC921_22275 [Synechococcaceae cyanobacterium SM2_3_1]|nr:hypothetical protein [Synechococcaceae cyanobacterium SM2_3_1]